MKTIWPDIFKLAEEYDVKRSAPGIPDRSEYGDVLANLKPKEWVELFIQSHEALKAGPHYDIRIGSKDTGLFSWASRKGLPEPGESKPRQLVQQPLHEYSYGKFEGEIPKGEYGAGRVKLVKYTPILITKITPTSLSFTIGDGKYIERFVLFKSNKDPKIWYLLNTTPTEVVKFEKPKFINVDADQAEDLIKKLSDEATAQAKIDGALNLIQLLKDKLEVISYRISKLNRPIVHTERIFGYRPSAGKFDDTLLLGEVYGVDEHGRAIPPQVLSGILNSSLYKSRVDIENKKYKMKVYLFDILKFYGKDLSDLPYEKRYELLKQIQKSLGMEEFEVPEQVKGRENIKKLLEQISKGKHPLTEEGIIIRDPKTGKQYKVKLTKEYDVYIREIFRGEGKYRNAAGGFYYSLTPDGPIVGKVGTGFDDDFRIFMWENKDDLIGRVARVKAYGQYPSGALRAPVFIALHESK
jgi:bifunctional non-homologous end joining protein LigD